MYSICYISAAVNHMSQADLVQLLETCKRKNSAINVTGLLLYNGHGTFIQVLEGDKETVENLYKLVKEDDRHCRVNCIARKHIAERSFPHWSMGFKVLNKATLSSIAGFSDFMESDDAISYLENNNHFALSLLAHFKQSSLSI